MIFFILGKTIGKKEHFYISFFSWCENLVKIKRTFFVFWDRVGDTIREAKAKGKEKRSSSTLNAFSSPLSL